MTVSQVAIATPAATTSAQASGGWQAPDWWPWPARLSDGPVTLRCACGNSYTHPDPAGDLTASRIIAAAHGWARDAARDDRCPDCVLPLPAVLTGVRF